MKSFRIVILLLMFVISSNELISQPLPPGGHGRPGDEVPGGGAPLNPALGFMLVLSGVYLAKKYRDNRELL